MANTDNDNLLESVAPHLKEHLAHLKAQRDDLDTKIREVEQHLVAIGHGQPNGRRTKRPRGANRTAILEWFDQHPEQGVGQAEVARAVGISSSSARATLDKLRKEGLVEQSNNDGSWRRCVAGDKS